MQFVKNGPDIPIELLHLHEEGELVGKKDSIENHFIERNFKIYKEGHFSEYRRKRASVTELLWKNRTKLSSFYTEILKLTRKGNKRKIPYDISAETLDIKNHLKRFYVPSDRIRFDGKNAFISMNDEIAHLEDCNDFTKYIIGRWFEEYVYLKLEPAVEAGIISDLRIGLTLKTESTAIQEFDILFKKNEILYILECKSGPGVKDHLIKLQNNIKMYAGSTDRAILVCARSMKKPKVKKIFKEILEEDKQIAFVSDQNVEKILELI